MREAGQAGLRPLAHARRARRPGRPSRGSSPRMAARLVEHDPEPEPRPRRCSRPTSSSTGRPLAPALGLASGRPARLARHETCSAPARSPSRTPRPGRPGGARADAEAALRHVQIEGSLSLTGAAADERWRATAAERRALALWLLRPEWPGRPAQATSRPRLGCRRRTPPTPARAAALVAELVACRGRSPRRERHRRSLRAARRGDHEPASRERREDARRRPAVARPAGPRPGPRGVPRGRSSRGPPARVFVLDLDPVDQLPGGEALATALAGLPLSVAITDRPTATAAACGAVAAAHHALERWGDFEPRAGPRDLRAAHAAPALRDAAPDGEPPALVGRGESGLPGADESGLGDARRSGGRVSGLFTRALPERQVRGALGRLAAAPAPGARFRGAGAQRDGACRGRRGRLGRRDEDGGPRARGGARGGGRPRATGGARTCRGCASCPTRSPASPGPVCVRLAPSRAEALGVADGDHVSGARWRDARSTLPGARSSPASTRASSGVPVGYGRTDGDGGVAGRERLSASRGSRGRLRTQRARRDGDEGRRARDLPLVQPHGDDGGARRSSISSPGSTRRSTSDEHHKAETSGPAGRRTVPQWHMVIDLDACTGCSACVVACQAENNVRGGRPGRDAPAPRTCTGCGSTATSSGDAESPDVLFEPMLCSQCEHAPCETVCPVAATVHSEDGLNQQVYNRCVGHPLLREQLPVQGAALQLVRQPRRPRRSSAWS